LNKLAGSASKQSGFSKRPKAKAIPTWPMFWDSSLEWRLTAAIMLALNLCAYALFA
jgi:hypothetical protein